MEKYVRDLLQQDRQSAESAGEQSSGPHKALEVKGHQRRDKG